MGIMNAVKGGADLTKPALSGGWMIGAFVGILILGVVAAVALFVLGKAKTYVPGVSTVTEGARSYMS